LPSAQRAALTTIDFPDTQAKIWTSHLVARAAGLLTVCRMDTSRYRYQGRARVGVTVWCPGPHGDYITVVRTRFLWADPSDPDAFILAERGAELVGPPITAHELLGLEMAGACLTPGYPMPPTMAELARQLERIR
jgi:hypothetical protein